MKIVLHFLCVCVCLIASENMGKKKIIFSQKKTLLKILIFFFFFEKTTLSHTAILKSNKINHKVILCLPLGTCKYPNKER